MCAPHSVCSNAAWARERSPGVTGGTKSGAGLGFPLPWLRVLVSASVPFVGGACACFYCARTGESVEDNNKMSPWSSITKHDFFGKEQEVWRVGKGGPRASFHLRPGRPVRLVWDEGGGLGACIDLILNFGQFKKGVS